MPQQESNQNSTKNAIVLLSGGLDSATALAIAKSQGFNCYCLSFDYGQRHKTELIAAKKVANAQGAIEHKILSLALNDFGGSALTDTKLSVPTSGVQENCIPITYVPARNTIMLSLALAWAEVLGSKDIFVGVNAVDYSGYPDCRPEYIDAFQTMANLATKAGVEGNQLTIHAPLIKLSKADIIQTGISLGVDYGLTISCYQATEQGVACGVCDSCRLRHEGFVQAGHPDPTPYAS